MVIDTSVLLHILFAEPGWERSSAFLLNQQPCLLSAPSVVEAQAVLAGRTHHPKETLDGLLVDLKLQVVPFTNLQARLARDAYLIYGKGGGHEAQLNFGDVMSYALAKDRNERLIFVGDDFHHTDLATVRLPFSL